MKASFRFLPLSAAQFFTKYITLQFIINLITGSPRDATLQLTKLSALPHNNIYAKTFKNCNKSHQKCTRRCFCAEHNKILCVKVQFVLSKQKIYDEKKSAAVKVAAGPFCQYFRIYRWLKQLCLLKMQLLFFFGVINHLLWRSHSTPSDANLHSIVAKNSKMYKRIKVYFLKNEFKTCKKINFFYYY